MVSAISRKILILITLLSIIGTAERVESTQQKLLLNQKEQTVNAYIQELKYDAIEEIETNDFYRSHFYRYKEKFKESPLFKVIRNMPKAASLDGNFFGLISHEYLYNLTHLSGLFIKINNNTVRFSYNSCNSSDWQHLRSLRKNRMISEGFIKAQFSFQTDDFTNSTAYAIKLSNIFNTVKSLLSKISVLKAALIHMLEDFYNDNVMYVEFRYSLDFFDSRIQRKYRPVQMLKRCNRIIKIFKRDHPGFFGAKIIYSPANQKKFDENLAIVVQLVHRYPKGLIGFDVKVDEVDLEKTKIGLRKIPTGIQLFLHFGNDVTFKNTTNLYLISSMANRPSRYVYNNKLLRNKAFYKHIKGLGVGINISPLSLVRGNLLKLRSHSSARYVTDGCRIIAGSEYPSFLRTSGISYDWYLMYIFMTDLEVDLSFLKYIALNSIIYSGLHELDAMTLISQWTEWWASFIEDMQSEIKSKVY